MIIDIPSNSKPFWLKVNVESEKANSIKAKSKRP